MRTLEDDRAHEEYLLTRPVCAQCQEPIDRNEDCIDLREFDGETVIHRYCLSNGFRVNALRPFVKDLIYDILDDKWRKLIA